MFALITLFDGQSFHMDFGGFDEAKPAGTAEAAPAPEALLEQLLVQCQEPEQVANFARQLTGQSSHTLPTLAAFNELESDAIRSEVWAACLDAYRQMEGPLAAEVAEAMELQDTATVVQTLLPSEQWQALRGHWYAPSADLAHAAFTPRNTDEVRVRARALLGLDGDTAAASEAIAFIADDRISHQARVLAVRAMGQARVAAAVGELVVLLEGNDEALQREAIIALGKIGRSAALEPLLSAWQANNGQRRADVLTALRSLSSYAGADYLRNFVEANSSVMVAHAVFISARHELTKQLPKDWLMPLLSSATVPARRDAALLVAAFGDETDATALESSAAHEDDAAWRALIEQGGANLARCGRSRPVDFGDGA